MPNIFISYRRSDSAAVSGRIYDRLCAAFGEQNIFKDVDDIPPGANYRVILEAEVSQCVVLLAIVGERWLNSADPQGNRRLDHPDDFVRIEIETGLSRPNVLVIPVLVDDAVMPAPELLPEALRDLHYRNAAVVRNDPDFNRDITRLVTTIQENFAPAPNPAPVTPVPSFSVQKTLTTPADFKLPWAGILAGVILVIGVLATLRLVAKIADNIHETEGTHTAQTATAQATLQPTDTPDIIATAEYFMTLTREANSAATPPPEVTDSG